MDSRGSGLEGVARGPGGSQRMSLSSAAETARQQPEDRGAAGRDPSSADPGRNATAAAGAGTKAGQDACDATVTKQEPEAMFHFMQDGQGNDLVNRHVEDNLRRTYDISAADEPIDDRFAALLKRIAAKQAQSGRP